MTEVGHDSNTVLEVLTEVDHDVNIVGRCVDSGGL